MNFQFSKLLAYVLMLSPTFLFLSCQGDSENKGGAAFGPSGSSQIQTSELRSVLTYDRADEYGVLKTPDLLVPMRDGFNMTCDLYQPAKADGKSADGKFPVVIKDLTGYGRSQLNSDGTTEPYVRKGYNVVVCNLRGSQGTAFGSPALQSIGFVDPWSEQEQQDNYDLIEWVAVQPWSSGKVGQTGGSYGGITSWLVAGRQKPPHLTAIAPIEASVDHYRHFFYPGGIPSYDRGSFAPLCFTLTADPTCSVRMTTEIRLQHPTYDSYWEIRKVDLSQVTIPVLSIVGQMDFFAPATNDIYRGMSGNPNFSMILGPWAHETPYSSPLGILPHGVVLSFFDRWLKGIDNTPKLPRMMAFDNIPPAAANDKQIDSRWNGFGTWPPLESTQKVWTLETDGSLGEIAGKAGEVSYAGLIGSVTFDTPVFEEAMTLTGPLTAQFKLFADSTDANIFARVDDIDPNGTVTDKGPGVQLKMSHRESDSNPTQIEPGKVYEISMDVPSKFWTIQKGHRLRLTLKGFDSTSPDLSFSTVSIITGKDGSRLTGNLLKPRNSP